MMDGGVARSLLTLRRVRAAFPADTVIAPGHGASTGMAAVEAYIAYLEALEREVVARITVCPSRKRWRG
jgi:glyoxylase-like metal-dependent hydrolase (beta-lactamase superfamily II)